MTAGAWTYAQAHPYLTVFILAMLVRIFIVVFISSYFTGQYVLDDETYDFMATDMAAGTTDRWDAFTHSLYWRTAAFLGPVTLIYKIFGPVKPIAQVFVALLGAGTAVFVVRLAMEFLTRRLALVAGAVIALLPSQAFWSSMLMKDAAVWICLTTLALVVAVAGRSTSKKLLWCGLGAALLLAALAFLREHTLVVAAWAVMLGSLAGAKVQRIHRIAGALVIGITIPWFVGAIGPAGLGLVTNAGSLAERRFLNAVDANTAVVDTSIVPPGSDLIPLAVQEEATEKQTAAVALEAEAIGFSDRAAQLEALAAEARARRAYLLKLRAAQLEERAERLREEAAALKSAAAAAIAEANAAVPLGDAPLDPNIAHIPRGLSVMLIEPLPVPFSGSVSLKMARLESLVWYPLLVLAVIGLWHARRHLRVLLMPLAAGAGILMMYALTEGNVGTAHRHRGELVWVVVILAALGTHHLFAMRDARRSP